MIMKRFCLSFFCLSLALAIYAVPAIPTPIEVTQPDGTTLTIRMQGDEHCHYLTTEDGYLLKQVDDQYFYAQQQDTEVVSTGVLAHNPQERLAVENDHLHTWQMPEAVLQKRKAARAMNADSKFPSTGAPRSLVILVNYSDVKFTVPNAKQAFTNLLNQAGYSQNDAVGSARDYFSASSGGAFQPIFDVVGPYTLPNTMAYYGGQASETGGPAMVLHACQAADKAGVNFAKYDYNKDGKIDNVFVYYAGNNEAEGGPAASIWPHRFVVQGGYKFDGKTLYDYACTSEYRGRMKTMCGIGTFCHEFSHVLGLADLYDTDYTKAETVGSWDLMASGSYNGNGTTPPSYTAFERFMTGWLTPEVLTGGCYRLKPLMTDNQAYIITSDGAAVSPNINAEYFMLENRQRVGWDAAPTAIPGVGMLVWHINYKQTEWDYNRPNTGKNLLCYIECASGNTMTGGTATDPFPGARKVTEFFPKWLNGQDAYKPILDIKEEGTDISFVFIKDPSKHLNFEAEASVDLKTTYLKKEDGTIEREMFAQKVQVMGSGLEPERPVRVGTSDSYFQISLDSITWQQAVDVMPVVDSTLNASVYLRYQPVRQLCDYAKAFVTMKQGAASDTLALRGTSPRPILITLPDTLQVNEITPFSAQFTWDAVEDASNYYISVYQLQDGNKQYIYQQIEFIPAEGESLLHYTIEGLTPGMEYGYTLQVSDLYRGGCEEHILTMSETTPFRTLAAEIEEGKLNYGVDSISYSQAERVIYLQEADGEHILHFYDLSGQLIASVPVAEHQHRVAFPKANFIRGNVYIVKYAHKDGIKRKGSSLKIMY